MTGLTNQGRIELYDERSNLKEPRFFVYPNIIKYSQYISDRIVNLYKINMVAVPMESHDPPLSKETVDDLNTWLTINQGIPIKHLSGEIEIIDPESGQIIEQTNYVEFKELSKGDVDFFKSLVNPNIGNRRWEAIGNLIKLGDSLKIDLLHRYIISFLEHEITIRSTNSELLRNDAIITDSRFYLDRDHYVPFPYTDQYLNSDKLEQLRIERLGS